MPERYAGHRLSLCVTTAAFAALEVDQIGLLVTEEVDKHPTLHFRERDLDRGPGQVAKVGWGRSLLHLLLDGVAARVGSVLLFRRLCKRHRPQKRVNKKIKNHPFEVSGSDDFSPRHHHHRHRGNKKSFIKFVSSTGRIIYFSSRRVSFLLGSFLFHHPPVLLWLRPR